MMKHTLLLLASLLLVPLTHAAETRVLLKGDKMLVLGGKSPTVFKFNVKASAGESVTITIAEGADDSADGGCNWHLDSQDGKKVLGKGFTKEKKKVSWTVKLSSNNPVLYVEDKDTNSGGIRKAGNGIFVSVTATSDKPANLDNYFGGPKAWYASGYNFGKADRKAKKKADVDRHKADFDKITAAEFRRGYMDAYKK